MATTNQPTTSAPTPPPPPPDGSKPETPGNPPDWAEEDVWALACKLHQQGVLNDAEWAIYKQADSTDGRRIYMADLKQGPANQNIQDAIKETTDWYVNEDRIYTNRRTIYFQSSFGAATGGVVGLRGGLPGVIVGTVGGGVFGGVAGGAKAVALDAAGIDTAKKFTEERRQYREPLIRETFHILSEAAVAASPLATPQAPEKTQRDR